LLGKLRDLPFTALPTYGRQYLMSYARRRLGGETRLATWGPRWSGIDDAVLAMPLAEVCAAQWQRCVEAAMSDLRWLPDGDVIEVRYEAMVASPQRELERVLTFLELPKAEGFIAAAEKHLEAGHVGK